MPPTECSNGHDLAVLGRSHSGRCIACRRARQSRYQRTPKGKAKSNKGCIKYQATAKGQIANLRTQLHRRIVTKEARVADLERTLQCL